MVALDRFFVIFSFGRQKKWSLVALDRWSSYTITIIWEFAWADSALVVLDEWSSYRGGRLGRCDCSTEIEQCLLIYKKEMDKSKLNMTD